MPYALLDRHLRFDPAADFEAFLKQVPARWVVYLLCDADDRPVQLLCVRNLRASLNRRFGGQPVSEPTKRIDYRQLVRHIHWLRVDRPLEADWIYYETAREIFPQSYRGLFAFSPAWFLHVDPAAPFPRYTRTTDLSPRPGRLLGPVADKHAAARLIELAEDAFDLCRYYNILTQSPHGRACAYKQMHKCPAPCDGSISLEQFRRLYEQSAEAIIHPMALIAEHSERMSHAAAALNFESAGRIKSYIEQLSQLGRGPFRHVRPLSNFVFLSLQRGPRRGTAKVFLITPGRIELIAGLIGEPTDPQSLLAWIIGLLADRPPQTDAAGIERIGLIAHHLFLPKRNEGVLLSLNSLDASSLRAAYRALRKQKDAEEPDAEGIVRSGEALRG